jgi:hypothetical protein
MSNLDPQNHYQPWSQKLQNLIDVSDDIVTMMSGTDDARLLAIVANNPTIGITAPISGIGTAIKVGASANVSGSAFALTATNTGALKVYADDAGTLLGESAVRAAQFRTLVTLSHSNETSIFGSQSQLKIKAPLDCTLTSGNRAGSWNYLEIGGTLTKTVTLSGTSKATAGCFGMVDWDGVGSLTLSANHTLAGFAALTNITKTGGTFTQTGKFAAFATLNNSSASYTAFGAGMFFGPNSVVTPFVFTDEADVASVTNGAYLNDISATANAGYIRVIIGSTVRYIPVYAAKS